MRRVTFQGQSYILVSDDTVEGAIATEDAYANGEASYAHLFASGRIMRFKQQIGTREDLVFGEEVDIKERVGFLRNVLLYPSWDP